MFKSARINFMLLCSMLLLNKALSQDCYINGYVKDSVNQPLGYVNIELYADSVFQRGTITDSLGFFRINSLACNQHFIIRAKLIGYHPVIDTVSVSTVPKHLNYILHNDSKTLGELVVSARRPLIKREADRIIYTINNSFVNGNSSAIEVLKTTPSVWVDENGGIKINGKDGVSVMINNKPVPFQGLQLQNYLNGISSEDISRIEVISVPGSEFDADKKGGVINIVTHKHFFDGYNARVFAGYEQGVYPEYSTGIFSNYKKRKFSATANFYIFQKNGFIDNVETRTGLSDPFSLKSSSFRKSKVNNHQLRLGSDYDINQNSNINFEYVRTFNNNDFKTNSQDNLKSDSINADVNGAYETNSDNIFNGASLNYYLNIDTSGSDLSVLMDLFDNDNQASGDFNSLYRNPVAGEILNDHIWVNDLHQKTKIFSIKTDYKKVFHHEETLRIGLKGSKSKILDDSFEADSINGVLIVNPNKTNEFSYAESLLAGYVDFSGGSENLNYKLGLRVENAQIDGKQNDVILFQPGFLDLFPSFSLLWQFGAARNNALSLVANRKIGRPYFEALNPFEYVENEFTVSRGNPYLNPEYTTNLEINYVYKDNYTAGLTYSLYDDVINNVVTTDGKRIVSQPQNISTLNSYGVNFSMGVTPIKEIYDAYISMYLTNNEYKSNAVNKELATATFRLNNAIKINQRCKLNISMSYSTRELNANRIYDPYGQVDISLSESFLKGKLTTRAALVDIFGFQNNNSSLMDPDISIVSREKYQNRKFQLFLFYNFSVGKAFRKKQIESQEDSEKFRLNKYGKS